MYVVSSALDLTDVFLTTSVYLNKPQSLQGHIRFTCAENLRILGRNGHHKRTLQKPYQWCLGHRFSWCVNFNVRAKKKLKQRVVACWKLSGSCSHNFRTKDYANTIRKGRKPGSVADLTFFNRELVHNMCWRISKEYTHGDYHAVIFEL